MEEGFWFCWKIWGFVVFYHYNHVFMHSRLYAWLNNESIVIWIEFFPTKQFIFACNMFMHYLALHIFLLSFLSIFSSAMLPFSSFLYLVSRLWHPRNLSLLTTQSHAVVLLLLLLLLLPQFLILLGSMMRRPNRTSMRNFLTEWFIRNARSFCLIF